jgi:hypothetical protein
MFALPRIFGQMTPLDKLDKHDPLLQQCLKDKPSNFIPTPEACGGSALQITFPPELILAMGISLASFAGSHLIQSMKASQPVDIDSRGKQADYERRQAQDEYEKARQSLSEATIQYCDVKKTYTTIAQKLNNTAQEASDRKEREQELANAQLAVDTATKLLARASADEDQARKGLGAVENAAKEEQDALAKAEGMLHKNASPTQACWSDIFRGTTVGTYKQVEMAKVQMFFFTVVILLAYGGAIVALLHNRAALLNPLGMDFPAFSESLNALLAISHGAYLTTRATVSR